MAKSGDYFGLDWVVSLILAIIPPANIVCGIITRVQRKNILGAVLNFFLCFAFYFIDLFCIITKKKLTILA